MDYCICHWFWEIQSNLKGETSWKQVVEKHKLHDVPEDVFGWWMDFPGKMAHYVRNPWFAINLERTLLSEYQWLIPWDIWVWSFPKYLGSERVWGPFCAFWIPEHCFKRPKDQFLTNADALLLGFEQVLVGHWIGGKYMWGQVPPTFVLTALDQIPQTLWQIWCLFFCPGLHLLRFLDTDTARKK